MSTPAGELLRTAEEIGRRISRQAVWHEDRCNWLGAEPLERAHSDLQPGVTYQALGPDLYSGTSGIALFLAELYAVTDEPLVRRLALGAIRHALSRVDAVPPSARLGLFSGWIGIAFAAVRVAMLLGETGFLNQARVLLQRSSSATHDGSDFDLMSGRAGAIAALVVLNHILDDSSLLDFGVRLGDELLETADKADIGYSWESRGLRNQHNLTGFSHGAAGAGYALLELFHATGDSKYRDAASLALQYERHWFDPAIGNWPDFREVPYLPYRNKRTHTFAAFWCHGAPGIALSRLRGYEILSDPICKAEAVAALNTTRDTLRSALDTWTGNFSMCHGLAGNAEVLSYATRILGLERGEDAELALNVANYGIERYSRRQAPWPCGTHVGETPNLMLGLAGIGHYYLRLHQPSVPSILILQKEAWRWGDRDSRDLVKPLTSVKLA
jgi:lantibiotic biosynthesis protein